MLGPAGSAAASRSSNTSTTVSVACRVGLSVGSSAALSSGTVAPGQGPPGADVAAHRADAHQPLCGAAGQVQGGSGVPACRGGSLHPAVGQVSGGSGSGVLLPSATGGVRSYGRG